MGTSFRRAALGIVATAVMLTVAPPVGAQAPAGDSVVGQIVEFGEEPTDRTAGAEIDVHSGPSGESPTGTASWSPGGGGGNFSTASVITCLVVTGRTAVIGFSGTNRYLDSPIAGLLRVVDGGGPDSAQDTFEWAETGGEFGEPPIPGPTDCSSYPSSFDLVFGPPIVNVQGDLVVTDSQPSPTSKAQCKNGGWQTYGVFKNQGDCISFVGKKPPAS
jgi:hypothetical protein